MKIELNLINESHVGEKYVDWLNDYDVVRYTEQRFTHHKESEIKSYVKHILSSELEFLYGIFHEGIHIGNIKIGPINTQHQVADMGYIIGEKAFDVSLGIILNLNHWMAKVSFSQHIPYKIDMIERVTTPEETQIPASEKTHKQVEK